MIFQDNGEWLKNRLLSMRPVEVISRIADVGRHVALRASLKSFGQRPDRRPEKADPLYQLGNVKHRLDRIATPARDLVVDAANGWLNHRATFFGLKDIRLGEQIDWHRDYSTGAVSPMRYSALINHRDKDTVGDVKYIWEINRLQHLVILALTWCWTRNTKYWLEIERQILSWAKSNPFMMGLNWKSPLEAGIRLISWAYVRFLTVDSTQSKELFHNILRHSIYQHQYFIRKFYSKHSSANNHLIGEMAGLYAASVLWPCDEDSSSWRDFARTKLIQEIDRQVEPDGVSKERATEYQLFILEFFLLAGTLGQRLDDPFPEAYWHRIHCMAAFLSAISDRSGHLPMLGDGDSGQVVWLPQTTEDRARSILRLFQPNGAEALEDLRSWLLSWGQTAPISPPVKKSTSTDSLQDFPHGGYYVLACDRGGENELVVVFDAGPLGLPPSYAHGHADALSFWLSYGGHEFLIDPGTYCYYNSPGWRSYFRGTAAHNTVRVDATDQSVPGGAFLWLQEVHCRVDHTNETNDFLEVTGSHDGYSRLQDPVLHTRSLSLFKKSRSLTITDRLECRRSHDIELLFHFSEKCHVRQVGPASFEAANGNKRVCVHLDSRLTPELYRGSENPILGWVSRTFGVKEPSYTLVARARIAGSTQFSTKIEAV